MNTNSNDSDTLAYLWAPELDPLFWREERTQVETLAWCGHVPFAHWLIGALKPRTFVELGTHRGVSYSAFCEAVTRNKLKTRCYAVDTWQGDVQTGCYSEDAYNDFRRFHDERYGAFSELLRCTFDQALAYFSDGFVDLLHIDGLHTYEAVRHDFEAWRSKLSERAVVLFHDTNVRGRDFGVWRLWEELRAQFPCFEFLHSYGLGVLAVGPAVTPQVAALCSLADTARVTAVRERFSFLGERSILLNRCWVLQEQELVARDARIRTLEAEASRLHADKRIRTLEAEASRLHADERIRTLETETAQLHADARIRTAENAQLRAEAEHRRIAEKQLRIRAARCTAQARAETGEALARLAEAETRAVAAFTAGRAAAVTSPEDKMQAEEPNSSMLRRTIDLAGWTCLRRLTEQLRRHAIDIRRGRLRASLYYLLKGTGSTPKKPSGSSTPDSGRERAVIETGVEQKNHPVRLLFISGEPDTPGHFYRIARYTQAAAASGARASWIRAGQITERFQEVAEADVLFIWRALWDERIASAVERGRSKAAKIVFDIDDLLTDPSLVRIDIIDGIRTSGTDESQWRKNVASFEATMLAADYCTAPTQELAASLRSFDRPALVLPNGFDHATYINSRRAVRRRRCQKPDNLVRIGYAGGTLTHQRDFAIAAQAVAQILMERPNCRLVLFRIGEVNQIGVLKIEEFRAFQGIENQIEWRDIVPLPRLPEEIARFDINLAPLEVGNIFCESKSELKFFEAALVDVPTVASPTGPLRRAIREGVTGFLANDPQEWYTKLTRLIDDRSLRYHVARAAQHEVLWRFGPLRRADLLASAISQWRGDNREATHAFAFELGREQKFNPQTLPVADTEILFERDEFGESEVTVLLSVDSGSCHVEETLESVRAQTLELLDLIILDSSNGPISLVLDWVRRNANRFSRTIVLRSTTDTTEGASLNAGFDAADTPFILLSPPGMRMLPECAAACLSVIRAGNAAFTYPRMRKSDKASEKNGYEPLSLARLVAGNYTDVPALISKEIWAGLNGFEGSLYGCETFDFWCKIIETGLWGCPAGKDPLAEDLNNRRLTILAALEANDNPSRLKADLEHRHAWLKFIHQSKSNGMLSC
jgi:glycosyltransferase involved in cell wall biosynthesis